MGMNDAYKPCSARKSLIMFHRDGTKPRVQRCHESTAEKHGLNVLPADCSACTVRKEITANLDSGKLVFKGAGTKTVDYAQIQKRFKDLGIRVRWKEAMTVTRPFSGPFAFGLPL